MKHLQYLRKALIDLYKRVIRLYEISDSNFNQCQLLAEIRSSWNANERQLTRKLPPGKETSEAINDPKRTLDKIISTTGTGTYRTYKTNALPHVNLDREFLILKSSVNSSNYFIVGKLTQIIILLCHLCLSDDMKFFSSEGFVR